MIRCTRLRQTSIAVIAASLLSGCVSSDSASSIKAYKGVINLEDIKFGVPEEVAKAASLTFVLDTNATPPVVQYLSRTYDKDGGQYALDYLKGFPLSLHVFYQTQPVSKEVALARLQNLLPASAAKGAVKNAPEVKVDKKNPLVETRLHGNFLKSELIYSENDSTKVKVVSLNALYKKGEFQRGSKSPEAPSDGTKTEAKTE
jgi:hypothetical protein